MDRADAIVQVLASRFISLQGGPDSIDKLTSGQVLEIGCLCPCPSAICPSGHAHDHLPICPSAHAHAHAHAQYVMPPGGGFGLPALTILNAGPGCVVLDGYMLEGHACRQADRNEGKYLGI